MKYYHKIFKDVLVQISRHKVKSFMTMFSIAIANLTILLIVSSNAYMEQDYDRQAGENAPISVDYYAGNQTKSLGFTEKDVQQVQKISGVKKAEHKVQVFIGKSQ